jgi:kynurenine formamidase
MVLLSRPRRAFIKDAAGIVTTALAATARAAPSLQEQPASAPAEIRTDGDVDRLLPRISNWGRWGPKDQLGTLNLITPERRAAAARLVRSGRTVSLAREVALSSESGVERAAHEVTLRPGGCRDYVAMVFHGFSMTHLDALCHVFADESRMYNGLPRSAVTTSGARALGAEVMAERGICGRGVLLDVAAVRGAAVEPGGAIRPQDLEAAERAHRLTVAEGDVLLVRTGSGRRNTRERRAGLHPQCLPWLHARGVALLGGDGDSDVAPLEGFDRWGSAMHSVAIPYLGLPLLDNAELDELGRACAQEGRWEFFFTMAPLRFPGTTGSAVNPLALL